MRKCIIKEHYIKNDVAHTEQVNGWFHSFCRISEIIPPSYLKGGHSGGRIEGTFAIVERAKDHRLFKASLNDVQFVDPPEVSENRPCEFFVFSDKPNLGIKDEGEWKKGVFRSWSTDHEEYESGPGPFPAAIVEDEEGSIHVVYAEHVRFPRGEK